MPRVRSLKALEVSQGGREELEWLVASRSVPAGLVRHAGIVLLCADGLDNKTVGNGTSVSEPKASWAVRRTQAGKAALHRR